MSRVTFDVPARFPMAGWLRDHVLDLADECGLDCRVTIQWTGLVARLIRVEATGGTAKTRHQFRDDVLDLVDSYQDQEAE